MRNSRSMLDLVPEAASRMVCFVAIAELELSRALGVEVKVKATSTLRDHEAQDELYAHGRTKPGAIKTNARGGESFHNYGVAVDFAIFLDDKLTWDKRYYVMLGKIGMREGLTWGGDWDGDGKTDPNDWDLVHFQYTGGLTLADLQNGKRFA